jgi:ring-1,2-phenylacetyl-CoA epoxidase subunit PaaD
MVTTTPGPPSAAVLEAARQAAASVVDPEIPTVTIAELGILRDVSVDADAVVVTITPTYSGCPAMSAIRRDVERALRDAGVPRAEVRTVLAPAWTTEWVTDEGRRKLEASGIAPPGTEPRCPRCRAQRPRTVSEFGSTACKALLVCSSCGEPFDLFKDL